MGDRRADPHHGLARLSVMVRTDQRVAVERLATAEDLTVAQATRRLLDLGLAHWSGVRLEELEGVAT